MNFLMEDSDGKLIAIPLQEINSHEKMQNPEDESEIFNNDNVITSVIRALPWDDGKLVLDNCDNSISTHEVVFLNELNLETFSNNEEIITDQIYQPGFDNGVLEIQTMDYTNDTQIDVHEDIFLNKGLPEKVNLIVTNDTSSPLCRLCACESEDMFYIFGLSEEEKDIAAKINSCLPITVQKTDTFPKKICFSCLEKLKLFHNFCTTVSQAEKSFMESKSTQNLEKNTVNQAAKKRTSKLAIFTASAKKSFESDTSPFNVTEIQAEQSSVNLSKPLSETSSVESMQEGHTTDHSNVSIRCHICNTKFFSERKCFSHASTHFSSNYYPCSLCEKILSSPEKWRNHYSEHNRGKFCNRRLALFKCQICSKKFVSEERLKFHIKFHESGAKHCYCEKCDKYVASESVLYQHSLKVHMQFKGFCCDICGNQFRSQVQLETHHRKHNNERPYECNICKKRFYSKDILRRHNKLHLPDKPFQCDQCGKQFDRTNSLTKHLLSHQIESKKSIVCQICNSCNQVFIDISQAEAHLESCSASNTPDRPQIEQKSLMAVYRCEFCQQCYDSVESAKLHRKSHSGLTPYVCTTCNLTYSTYNQATAHKSAHRKSVQDIYLKGEIPLTKFFFCESCDKQFLHYTNMNVHRKSCTNSKKWTCRSCMAVFHNSQELKQHKKRKDSSEIWSCKNCEMNFENGCTLKLHKEVHSEAHANKKVFICSNCKKEFQCKTHFTIHQRSHTGERPYGCDLCDKTYTIKADRDHHRRTHTGERPYKCKICEKTFTNPPRLREHMLYHSDVRPYKCDFCNQAFRKSYAKKVHMTIHTGEKPFRCDICGNQFRRSGDMNKHKKTQHAVEHDVEKTI